MSAEVLGRDLAYIVAALLVLTGVVALWQPAILSHLYGCYAHERNGRAFVRATGARDVVFGVIVAGVAVLAPGGLRAIAVLGMALSAADAAIVFTANSGFVRELIGHFLGFAAFAALFFLVGIGL